MKNRFYKATEEDFHKGFEYYVLEKAQTELPKEWFTFMPFSENDEYLKYIFPDPFVGWSVEKLMKHSPIIKYLDEEDIEQEGFEPITDHEKWGYLYGAHFRKDHAENKSITLRLEENNKIIISIVDHYGYEDYNKMVFTIKNKSELKRILKMLEL